MAADANEADAVRPRHAQVVPAFVAADIRRPLDSWVGPVQPIELLRWERKGDLAESARQDLRQVIVKRSRPRAERLWIQPVGVRLADGWREGLTTADRKLIERLDLTAERPLEVWTLREVKEALHVPLEQTLGLLAKLEAVYWQPPPASQRRARSGSDEYGPPVILTDELRQRAAVVLQLAWLGHVTARDLRFSYPGEGSLSGWMAEQLAGLAVPAAFPALVAKLLQADTLTAEEEARDLVEAAARECAPRADVGTAQRWVDMMLRRHISPVGAGRLLADVGVEFKVTRERIRQVCETFEELFAAEETCTPALDRALLAAARVAPMGVDELDVQLRRFVGDGAGFECLVAWARVLGHEDLPVCCERARMTVRGQSVEVTMIQTPNAEPWVEAMIRHVSRDSSMFGCTNLLRIAGRLALKEGLAPGQESMEAALEGMNGFKWLDRETGWFTLGDTSGCSAASRVRKIMAVAHGTVGTDEIAAAFASDDMWMYRENSSLGLATPPVHVLRELFRQWPWLTVVQKGRFVPSESFDPTGALTEAEQACVDVIKSQNGVACRFELKEVVIGKLGLTDVALAAMLGSSPVFGRLEHGLYCIFGRKVGDGALNAARSRARDRLGPQTPAPADLGSNEFVGRITEASLKNEQYSVPARFHDQLAGKRHLVIDDSGEVVGEARVSQSGALAGINRLFRGQEPDDQYRIEVRTGVGLCVRHVRQSNRTDVSPRARADLPAAPSQSLQRTSHPLSLQTVPATVKPA